jgi:AraC family transcriptional regulator, regulatory protein of adaptative response / DNA-3-methyladenine glycosylase II
MVMNELDPDSCYRSILARDRRFDGRFFIGVLTTKIYCRPICPAKTPNRENCIFFLSAAAAQQAGFRSCLRCRPELSPHLFAYLGTGAIVARALRAIEAGALDEGSVTDLAGRLGVGDRHLRQLFKQHVGTSPLAVARTRRLLFAKQLLDETSLSMTDVSMAAGFASIRSFNLAIERTYGRSPSQLRGSQSGTPTLSLRLPFSPPFNWSALIEFFAVKATAGMEVVTANSYRRSISLDGHHGAIEVSLVPNEDYLMAQIWFPHMAYLGQIVARLRRMFDLGANVTEISAHLERDPVLAPVVQRQAGLRIPGAWEPFELAVRAILGQQVSLAAATTLSGRLIAAYGEPLVGYEEMGLHVLFPSPQALMNADLTGMGMPKARGLAIAALAEAVVKNPQLFTHLHGLADIVKKLCALPGIGKWTALYIAMRALGEPDAFPSTDLILFRSMEKLGDPVTKAEFETRSQIWRPWRAYAAMHLWTWDGNRDREDLAS